MLVRDALLNPLLHLLQSSLRSRECQERRNGTRDALVHRSGLNEELLVEIIRAVGTTKHSFEPFPNETGGRRSGGIRGRPRHDRIIVGPPRGAQSLQRARARATAKRRWWLPPKKKKKKSTARGQLGGSEALFRSLVGRTLLTFSASDSALEGNLKGPGMVTRREYGCERRGEGTGVVLRSLCAEGIEYGSSPRSVENPRLFMTGRSVAAENSSSLHPHQARVFRLVFR